MSDWISFYDFKHSVIYVNARHRDVHYRRIAEDIRALIPRASAQLGERAGQPDAILDGLRRIRKDGYAFGGVSDDDGTMSIALPLPVTAAGIQLVLGLNGPVERILHRKDRLVALMRAAIDDHARPMA